ncbi:RmlC-like cupin domain-containing protein [Neohortaea acidophila]|uniref:RmlC-like cupin domain-containing protein n=1 Tax=Neohortaea acidophila TaxID=245834 RepID=A0A6A6PYQ0_9PEZI|nr:RmlC-like cupin domain-containing protein [Neohortaea acidophila]KAF2484881.1 RmlC-like cupin domain-containing protein [Neohortaea acidophila]
MHSTNGNSKLAPLETPPGRPDEAYVLQSLCGELIYIPCSKSIMRLAVTGKETNDSFCVVGTGGAQSDPIGFHYHRQAHDVFLCIKGNINVWANDQCRTLGPGDFASVPPGVIHQYQIVGDYTEFLGLIVPGGWEEFFRFIGEPYNGPLFPLTDDRNVFQVLIPKLKAAAEQFDMVPVRDHPSVEPQAWIAGKDDNLPGALEPYFLRAGTGPRHLIGGVVCTTLAGMAESNGRFSIASIEGCSAHEPSPLSKGLTFDEVHHAFYVVDGSVTFKLGNEQVTLTSGQSIFVPQAHSFAITFASRFAKAYVFTNGEGLPGLLRKAGTPFQESIPPANPTSWEESRLREHESSFKFSLASA